MLIDWFTVAAQALNFIILVWLLKRYLYRPILNAIDARDKRIAKELADANTKETEAEKERDKFQKKNETFDRQRNELMSKAKNDAEAERQRLFDEARQAADALRAKRQETLNSEFQNLHQEIIRHNREEVFAIARKMLTDLAGTTLEDRMCEVFTRRLRELGDKPKEELAKALKTSRDPVLVQSAFELAPAHQAAIQQALNKTFSSEIRVRFETAPDVISGIKLTVNGWKLAWNISDYLTSLEKSVGESFAEQPEAEIKPEIKAKTKAKSKAKSGTKPAAPKEAK